MNWSQRDRGRERERGRGRQEGRQRGHANEELRMQNPEWGRAGNGGNGGDLPVRSSVAAFYRWIMSFESSGQPSGGRESRPVLLLTVR